MPEVSIIVPVYNVEKYLVRCIESIVNQTFKNIELILINDGSIDNSKSICEKYLKEDNRIKLINKMNEGVSSARNIGIDEANGNYITFIDPDDYIEHDAIEYLYNLIKEYNADISCYKMKTFKNTNSTYSEEDEKISLYKGENILKMQIKYGEFLYSSCNKLYSRHLFNGINDRFNNEIKYAEDALFNLYMISKCKILVYSNLRKYNYYINQGSTVNKLSIKRIDVLKAQRKMFDYIDNTDSNYTQDIIKQYVNSSILIIAEIAKCKMFNTNWIIIKELNKQLKRDKNKINNLKGIDIITKFKYITMKASPIFLLIVYKTKYVIYKVLRGKYNEN